MARAPRAAVQPGARGKHPVFEHAESIAKLATVILGVLYVLGVLISNVQLMELGISDFGALQPRNILTGFFFVFYVALLLFVLTPIVAMLVAFRRIRRWASGWEKVRWYAFALVCWLVAFLFAMLIAGELVGFLYPWGLSFRTLFSGFAFLHDPLGSIYRAFENLLQSWAGARQKTDNFWEAIVQFVSAYAHLKIAVASLLLILAAAPLLLPTIDAGYEHLRMRFDEWLATRQDKWWLRWIPRGQAKKAREAKAGSGSGKEEKPPGRAGQSKKDFDFARHFAAAGLSRRRAVVYGIIFAAVVLPMLIFDYAEEVYPNLTYNLGGGQPQVAQLIMSGKGADTVGSGAAGLRTATLCCGNGNLEQAIQSAEGAVKNGDGAIRTEEVAIWYQSDKFLYVSALSGIVAKGPPTPAPVIAIDVKLVRNLVYRPKYVEVYSGGSIKQIWRRDPDGTIVLTGGADEDPSPPQRKIPLPPARVLGSAAPIVWAQLHPDKDGGEELMIARAVVEDGGPCPPLRLERDGRFEDENSPVMTERWSATDGPFPIKVCETAYSGTAPLRIGGTVLKTRPRELKQIVVIGDTGCRIFKWGLQDCNDADEWPFKKIADQIANLEYQPQLIIHLGDYHYREACPKADAGKCAGVQLGDNWPVWRADFFTPAAKLLTVAPWVMLRGNHEDMERAGLGWRLLLSPFPRAPDEVLSPDDARPYTLRFDTVTFAILDVANANVESGARQRGEKYVRWIDRLAGRFPADRAQQSWLFLHVPPWVSRECKPEDPEKLDRCQKQPESKEDPMGMLRSRFRQDTRPKFDLAFGGDTHMFQFFAPRDRTIPSQIVAGMSGDMLEPQENYDRAMLDKKVDADLFDVAGKLWMHYGFGYLVLTKKDGVWSAALNDQDGKLVLSCDLAKVGLDDAQGKFPCTPAP